MSPAILLRVGHLHRGSWLAEALDAYSRRIVGAAPFAVLRDWGTGQFHWTERPPRYVETAVAVAGQGVDWWSEPVPATWRSALTDGAIVWVRAMRPNGTANASVGRSKGVWRIGEVEIGTDRLSLALIERIGDVRT